MKLVIKPIWIYYSQQKDYTLLKLMIKQIKEFFTVIRSYLTFDLNFDPSPMGHWGIFYTKFDTNFKKQSPQVDFENY